MRAFRATAAAATAASANAATAMPKRRGTALSLLPSRRSSVAVRPCVPPALISAHRSLCDSALVAGVGKGGSRFRAAEGYGFDPLADSAGSMTTTVDGYSAGGFVVNGVSLRGAVLLTPRLSLLFEPLSLESLSVESLSFLSLLEPIELLIIGSGRQVGMMPEAPRRWLTSRGVCIELLNSRTACSTFNFMLQERRSVAAILFPMSVEAAAKKLKLGAPDMSEF